MKGRLYSDVEILNPEAYARAAFIIMPDELTQITPKCLGFYYSPQRAPKGNIMKGKDTNVTIER